MAGRNEMPGSRASRQKRASLPVVDQIYVLNAYFMASIVTPSLFRGKRGSYLTTTVVVWPSETVKG